MRGGPRPAVLDRAALLAMPQHTAVLPIACVEGWSTTQAWTGVRLADLARLAGVPAPESADVSSLERSGAFGRATLQGSQVLDPDGAAGTAGQRRRPVPGSRLPGAHHRAGAARGAQHQVGGVDRLPCGRKCLARERFS